jgi:predicted DNA-binding transcriptional regulator YafY
MSFTPDTLLRHWQTLRRIPRHPLKITAAELCQHLGSEGFVVGKRTVERDLHALSSIFPLVADERSKPYGWSWSRDAPSFDLPGLSGNQALTLLMAREYLRAVMPGITLQQLEPYFRQAEQHINTIAGHSALASWLDKVRIVQPTQPLLAPLIDNDVLSTVQHALLNDQQCLISYHRRGRLQAESYPLSPLALVQRGQALYLVATIKRYSDIRLLALQRILSAETLAEPALRPTGFDLDDYMSSGAFGWGGSGAIRLRLRFSQRTGAHLNETPLSLDQTVSERADGQLELTATVQDTQQLLWWLRGFGDEVEVVEPSEMRAKMRVLADKLAARYAREPGP